ncbi:NAD(P)/FAD-dependent oxidoreductase [Marinactinospora rubrisoli]|uniref:NAD(P)/FAD-dependent oxidoreductase n=1 Tax=Marinactinospora rubrisoli TaxID=2715399 RepID=A0ABW2KD19_9ACTN
MRSVTVVGASLAGLTAARALRDQGFDGRLTVVGAERHRPYDRPPLSKDFLLGRTGAADLALHDDEEEAALAIEWVLGRPAVALDPRRRAVRLADGREIVSDGLVIATGAAARRLPGADMAGVHTLRTLDDAEALRAGLSRGRPSVVIVGGSFIGAEIASSCAALGLDVTVVEAAPLPLAPVLGTPMARVCAGLHADHGVRLMCGVQVAGLAGGSRVTGVRLADGRVVRADVVVMGVGVRPGTDWLAGSGVRTADGVVCDPGCRTSVPGVVAAGDVARLQWPGRSPGRRVEHWSNATEQPVTAVRNLLAGALVEESRHVPYFWSDQYGVRLQFAGAAGPGDEVRVEEGDPRERSFAAVYLRDGEVRAVLAMNRPRPFARLRRRISARRPPVAVGT